MPNSLPEPLLDADDIQASILPGFTRAEQVLAAYTVADLAALKALLKLCAGSVTPMSEAMPHKQLRKSLLLGQAQDPLPDPLWLSISLGRGALALLGEGAIIGLDPAFSAGMWRRQGTGVSSRLGDPVDPLTADGDPNPAYPPHWVLGGAQSLDVLLIFAGDVDVERRSADLRTAATRITGVTASPVQSGWLLPDNKEHFGFVDGISTPGVYGLYAGPDGPAPVSTRYGVPSKDGVDFGRPGQPLSWPGQFLFGAPRAANVTPASAPPNAKNGSFLVFRRLNQNVATFYADTQTLAAQFAAGFGDPSFQAERCRALVVGRWPNGEPVMRAPLAQPAQAETFLALNYFDYATDLVDLHLSDGSALAGMRGDPSAPQGGQVCPSWAHLRKTNPRDLGTDKGGPSQTQAIQILRRGIPFGPLYDHSDETNPQNAEERGLLFMSYQTSIADTFETVITDWMDNGLAPPPGKGADLLVGQLNGGVGGKPFSTVKPDGADLALATTRHWVYPTGGAYLFTPARSAIAAWTAP